LTPSLYRLGVFLLTLMCICSTAGAQTVFDVVPTHDRHVYELSVGKGHPGHHHPAIAGRGFHYANSYSLIYLVNILPGSYSLALSYPAGNINQNPVVSIFDRWPYDANARWYDLPMGPTVMANRKKTEYRWSMGISPQSTSTLLYITVEVPAGAYGSDFFPHDIFVMSPQSSPMYTTERGITFLSGPADLVLTSGQAPVSYVIDAPEEKFSTSNLPPMAIPGDLVKNGAFRKGLNGWTPHRDREAADNVQSFSLKDGVLKIRGAQGKAREGVMQKLGADVTGVSSLILRADVQVTEQTSGGLGPENKDAPMAIAVGYRTASGKEAARSVVFWKGFYLLPSEDPNRDLEGQKVPKGDWYRYMFDLMQLDPKPAAIEFISLEGSGWPAREGLIREVHLIKSGGNK
jgi:hypothetical protein